jgi:hypothetical protein
MTGISKFWERRLISLPGRARFEQLLFALYRQHSCAFALNCRLVGAGRSAATPFALS